MYIPRKHIPKAICVIIVIALASSITTLAVHFINGRSKPLGRYVYIDHKRTLHTHNKCPGIYDLRGWRPVTIIGAHNIEWRDFSTICTRCVSDETYEEILGIAAHTEQ